MSLSVKLVVPILVVCICILGVLSATGAAEESRETPAFSTEFIPVLGGFGMGFSVTDHDKNKTYLYSMSKKNEPPELVLTFDLTSAGNPTLGTTFHESE